VSYSSCCSSLLYFKEQSISLKSFNPVLLCLLLDCILEFENVSCWGCNANSTLTTSLTGPSRTKLLSPLLLGNPTILTTTKSGSMYEIYNVEVIINIFIRSSRDPRKKRTTPQLITTALNPKRVENVACMKSIHIKGVNSSSQAKGNGESRTNEHSHNSQRHLPEVYRSRSVGVDSGRSRNDFPKREWSLSWFF